MARKLNRFYLIEIRQIGKDRKWVSDGFNPKLFDSRKEAVEYISRINVYHISYYKNAKFVPLRVRIEVDDKRWTRQSKDKP